MDIKKVSQKEFFEFWHHYDLLSLAAKHFYAFDVYVDRHSGQKSSNSEISRLKALKSELDKASEDFLHYHKKQFGAYLDKEELARQMISPLRRKTYEFFARKVRQDGYIIALESLELEYEKSNSRSKK